MDPQGALNALKIARRALASDDSQGREGPRPTPACGDLCDPNRLDTLSLVFAMDAPEGSGGVEKQAIGRQKHISPVPFITKTHICNFERGIAPAQKE
jgi:hypothetical protein